MQASSARQVLVLGLLTLSASCAAAPLRASCRTAIELFEHSEAVSETADFSAAAGEFERAAAKLDSCGDRFAAWLAFWQLGRIRQIQGLRDAAVAAQRDALRELSQIPPSSLPRASAALPAFAAILDLGSAATVDSKVLRVAELKSRAAIVMALVTARRDVEAEAELPRLVAVAGSLESAFAVEATFAIARLRLLQGRDDQARSLLRRVLDEPVIPRTWEQLAFDNLMGLEIERGRQDAALAWSDRALALARRRQEPGDEARQLLVRSLILDRTDGAAAEAILAEAEALALRDRNAGLQGSIENRLGMLALRARQPEKAAAHFQAAISLLHAARMAEEEARAWIQLAYIYLEVDRETGVEAVEKAKDINRRLGSPLIAATIEAVETVLRLETGAGDVSAIKEKLLAVLSQPEMFHLDDPDRIAALFDELSQVTAHSTAAPEHSGAPFSEPRGTAWAGMQRLLRGVLDGQRGDFVTARQEWLGGLAEEPSPQAAVVLSAFIGMSYEHDGSDAEAIRYLVQAAETLEHSVEDLRLEEFLAGRLGRSGEIVYSHLVDLLARNGRVEEAFDYSERARARAFLLGLGNERIEAAPGTDPALAREAESLKLGLHDLERRAIEASPELPDETAAELERTRKNYRALLLRLKVADPAREGRRRIEPQRLEDIRAALGPDTTLVSYFVTSSRLHAWTLDRASVHHIALPIRPADLEQATCWTAQLAHEARGALPLTPRCTGQGASAGWLYAMLIASLPREGLHRQLLIVPHGPLHAVPFAALRNSRSGRFLIEDHVLSYLPSASALPFLRAEETPVEGRAVVLGAPDILDPKLGALPGARQEAIAVGRLLGTHPWLGAEATESRVFALAGTVDLLHLAAHGIYEPRNPSFSRIALSPTDGADGNLEVHEIVGRLDLSGVNLVVLSACDTARGEISRGDEITSLTRAFLLAGSPGVVSTLWRIDDDAATLLMTDLYQRLLCGASVAEALRDAQLQLRRNPRYEDPRFWGAFALSGDPQGRWGKSGSSAEP